MTLIEGLDSRQATLMLSSLLLETADVCVAALLLVFLSPLLLVVALCIRLEDSGPALFGHVRIGRNGKPFRCLKFRSMHLDADQRLIEHLASDEAARLEWALTQKLRADPRVTKIGRFLRKSSLDELPQFMNVLRREMSLVGPRPIVPAEVSRYGHRFGNYCSVLPGITGLWQVSGRNDVSYRRRVAMDVVYARHRCVSLYVRVLLMTLPAVMRSRGAY